MPQKIENKDIFSPDFLEPQKKSFKELLDLIQNIEAELKDVLKVQKEMVNASDKKSVEGLKARQQAIKTVGVASKELMNLEKQRIGVEEKSKIASQKVAQQIQKTSQQQLKTKQQKLKLDKEILNAEKALSQAIQQEKKAIQQGLKVQQEELKIKRQKLSIEIQEKKELQRLDNIKQKEIATAKKLSNAAAKENSEYFKQSKRLNELKRKYQDLILVQGKETRASRKLLKEVTRLDTKLKKVDASVGNFQRSVGNYGKAFGKVTGVLRNFGLAVGGLAIIRNITGIVSGFEQSQADLASVLGVNVDEMKALTEQARELGATTRFTAGEVAGLQKEFAKLGFDQSEIQNMTEATLSLAAATGTELAEAAAVAGGVMNAFGLDSSQTQRAVDVMAASFSKSALDMEKFKETMKTAAPIAKATGVSLEQATAAAGKLADANISGSKAGTDLKNIFSQLIKDGKPLEESLNDIATELDGASTKAEKLAIAEDLVGERAKGSLLVLVEQREALAELQGGLENSGGAAKEMADKQLNTLNGALDLLKSAWEGFILDLNEGTGAFAGLKDILFFVARNLKTIIKSIVVATSAFAAYKLTIVTSSIVTKALSAVQIAFAGVQTLLAGNVKRATAAMRLFNTSVKLNPLGLLISLLAAAVTAYNLFSDTTTLSEKKQNSFNEGLKQGAENAKNLVDELALLGDEERRLIKIRETSGEITSEEASKERSKLLKKEVQDMNAAWVVQDDLLYAEKFALEGKIKQMKITSAETVAMWGDISGSHASALRIQIEREEIASEKRQGILSANITAVEKALDDKQKEIDKANAIEKGKAKAHEEKITEDESKAREKRAKELGLYLIRLQDLRDAAIENEEKRSIKQINRKFKRDIDSIKGNSKIEKQLRLALKYSLEKEIEEIENEFRKKRADEGLKISQLIGEQEQEQLNESIKLQEIAAQKELDLQLEIAANKPEEVDVDKLEKLLNERYDLIKRALEDERDLLRLNGDLSKEELELIDIQFKNKLAENERARVKTIDDANDKIIDAQITTSEKVADINTKAADEEARRKAEEDAKRKKQQQDQLTALKSFAAKAIEIADAKTDKEISNIDKELEANKKRQDELQTLAAQGNLAAEQSIGAEIKRELELERQKEALEKKKARRQIIIEGLDLLSSKIDSGEKDAVTSTLNDMTRLLGALSALPGFIDGTETTVGAALGKPQLNTGVDDYIVRVDGSEKILNPNMSARTGNMTTEEITRAAEMYSSGMFDQNVLIHPQVSALNQPFQNSNEILKKFDSLESTIRNKPILSDLKFDDLQKALIVTVEQNGDLKRAHYKLK